MHVYTAYRLLFTHPWKCFQDCTCLKLPELKVWLCFSLHYVVGSQVKFLCICCVDSLNTGFIICCWAVWSEKLSVHSVSSLLNLWNMENYRIGPTVMCGACIDLILYSTSCFKVNARDIHIEKIPVSTSIKLPYIQKKEKKRKTDNFRKSGQSTI